MTIFNKIVASKAWWLWLILLLVVLNYAASVFHARFDLTKEKRYTLSKTTKGLLKTLDDDVQVDVFLKGRFPSKFRKMTNSVSEFLRLLKEANTARFNYTFISPDDIVPGTAVKYADSLKSLQAYPINLKAQVEEGEASSLAFPYAIIRYEGKEQLIKLFAVSSNMPPENVINKEESLLEYKFARALDGLLMKGKPLIGYSAGNGEPDLTTDYSTADLQMSLSKDYNLFTLNLNRQPFIPDTFKVLLMVKPTLQFTEAEKLKMDQYLMRGGKLLLFIDNLFAEQDSLRTIKETVAFDRNLNLTDLLFRYGVRINTDLVMDLQCDYMPFVVGGDANNPQFEFLKWNYYPLFESKGNHTINKSVGLVAGRFVNSLDTIATPGVHKTVLLSTSADSRTISTPALISLNENKNLPKDIRYNKSDIPVAMLLEGKFTSLYRNRASRSQLDSLAASGQNFMPDGNGQSKIIVVADGDILLNDISPKEGPLPMGLNLYTVGSQFEYQFANREFLLNCLEFLINKAGIIETRNKDIVLRLLDGQKVKEQKTTWQFINIALPVLLVIVFGWLYQQLRKRKYAGA
jgi:gliding-associated putative ABC transporter substrate-binding component GldG